MTPEELAEKILRKLGSIKEKDWLVEQLLEFSRESFRAGAQFERNGR